MPTKIPYWRTVIDTSTNTLVTKYLPNTNIPSIEEMREVWCFGLPLTQDNGEIMPDTTIKHYIDGAIAEVERRLGIFLKPTIVVCNPDERGISEDLYDEEEHPYDYDVKSWRNYGFIQLRKRPLIELNAFKMVLPNGNVMMDFFHDDRMRQWVKIDKSGAQLNVIPYAGDPTLFAMLGGSGAGYPFVTGSLNSRLPHTFYVDYVTGFKQYKIPKEISEVVAKVSAINLLGVAGDAVMVGISSISTSLDGLSESTSLTASAEYSTYGAHISQLKKEVEDFFKPKGGGGRTAYRGITMTGL